MAVGATMPAFSDERLSMRPVRLLRIGQNSGPCSSSPWPAASRESWMRPPTPPTEPSAGVERWIGGIKLYRLWLKRRSSCLSPFLGAYGLQDAPPRSGQPNTMP